MSKQTKQFAHVSRISEQLPKLNVMFRIKYRSVLMCRRHEAPLQLETREMRIWMTNALFWSSKKEDDEARFMAVFLDMSRVNHSCVPNAEYHQDGDGEQMHLTSTKTICAGEEVTICYNDDFYYKTGTERNAFLQYTYDFTCKCRACLDSDFAPISDQRRHMLKQVWYCELYGWPVAPNFSTKISSYEDAISMQANNSLTSKDNHGPPKPVESPKPSALQRAVKLEYDEGLTTVGLIKFMFTSAMAFLLDLKKRGQPPNEFPFGKEFQRNLTLLSTSESFLGKLYPPQDIKQKSRTQGKIDVFGMFNARIKYEAMTAADCLKLISEIMDDELDPLTTRLIDG